MINKNTIFSLLIRLLAPIVAYGVVLSINRLFSAEIYGQYTLTIGLIQLCSIACCLGWDTAIIKTVSTYTFGNIFNKIFSVWGLTAVCSALATIVFYTVHNSIADVLSISSSFTIAGAFSILPYAILRINCGILVGTSKPLVYSAYEALALPSLTLITLFIFYFANPDFISIPSILLLSYSTTAILSTIYIVGLLKNSKLSNFVIETVNTVRESKNTFPIAFSNIISIINIYWSGIFILGILANPIDVAIFAVILRFADITGTINRSILGTELPRLIILFNQENKKKALTYFQKTIVHVCILNGTILLGIYILSNNVMELLGEEYIEAAFFLRIILIFQFFYAALIVSQPILNHTGQQRAVRNISLCSLLISASIAIITCNHWGYKGALLAYICGSTFNAIVSAHHLYKSIKMDTTTNPIEDQKKLT